MAHSSTSPSSSVQHSPINRLLKKLEIEHDDACLPFTFDIPDTSLKYVDSEAQLNEFANHILCRQITLVGIDTETRPSFYTTRAENNYRRNITNATGYGTVRNRTSLFQIALRDCDGHEVVFIIDLLVICTDQSADSSVELSASAKLLDRSLASIFMNQEIIKMGQGLANDLRELVESYPRMTCFQTMLSILDTNAVLQYMQPQLTSNKSLKYMVKTFLHSNLIKTQQVSDWGRRPLTKSQIYYAACDALVLIRLHDAMLCEAEEFAASRAMTFVVGDLLSNFNQDDDAATLTANPSKLQKREQPVEQLGCGKFINAALLHDKTRKFASAAERAWFSDQLKDMLGSGQEIASVPLDVLSLPIPASKGQHFHFEDAASGSGSESTSGPDQSDVSSSTCCTAGDRSNTSSAGKKGDTLPITTGKNPSSPNKRFKRRRLWAPLHGGLSL